MSKKYFEDVAKKIVERARAKANETEQQRESAVLEREKFTEVIQLPLWPEPQRAAPNVVLRSSLFGLLPRGSKREYLKKTDLATWGDAKIRYTGIRLDQYDADVWFQVLHYSRLQASPSGITFTARAFLRDLGRTQSGQDVKRLGDSFTRMVATAITVTEGKHTYVGSLVHEFTVDEATGRYRVVLNPRLAKLFDGGYTRFDWQLRQGLKTDLAKWLHAFVLSHRASEGAPQYVAFKDLYALSGAKTKLKDFRWNVKSAMAQLLELGVVSSWRLTENDALGFTRARPRPRLA